MNRPVELIAGPIGSAACLLRGLTMLAQPGLRRFLWGPLLINVLLYSLGFWAGGQYFSSALDALIPGWLEWLRWLLWPLFAAMLAAVAFFSFTLVANLVASPFYGLLAEKVLKGQGLSASEADEGLLAGIVADLGAALRRIGYFALCALPLLLLSAIPVVNLAAPFLWLLFGAWSLSLEYLSYPFEAQRMRFDALREFAKSRRLETLAFGGLVMLGLGLPVLNVLIPPAAVIGASLYVAQRRGA